MFQTQTKNGLKMALLIGTITATALSISGAATAAEVETVVVTGSRIPVANLTSVSPILSVSSKEFSLKGATDVSDMLNDLPQAFVSNTGDFTNGQNPLTNAGGVTTVDLRGLGPTRTLVLVNGRRLGVGDPDTADPNAAPDIDQIPVPLVERVEVLTGGASATYGSDAVAGVVNFIMKKDFEGVQVDGQFGGYWHDNGNKFARNLEVAGAASGIVGPIVLAKSTVFDGKNSDASIVIGSNSPDGKGNVTGYFVYRNADPIFQRNRDFSECQINIPSTGPVCAGSSNSNLFQPENAGQPHGVFSIVGHSALPRPFPGSVPAASFNANQFEVLSRSNSRYSGGFFGHYDINSWAKPYAEVSFMDDRSMTAIAPDAVFQFANAFSSDNAYRVNCDNPLLSAQEVGVLCKGQAPTADTRLNIGRRNIEGGSRTSTYEHMNFRGVVGVQGDFMDAWHYDVYGSYYYVTVDQQNGGYFSNANLNKALEVVSVGGVPTCKSVVDGTDAACVPYNIFTQGGVTADQLAYLGELGTSRGTLQEEILEADVTGDLGKYGIMSPFAETGVQISLGGTNRKDKLVFQADAAEQSGDLLGFGGAAVPIHNASNVIEYYGEFRAPLVEKNPTLGDLDLEGGIRFSEYTGGRRPTTWKGGLEWTPNADIRFRTSYDVAVRAPSLLELFTPAVVTNTSLVSVDPCAPTNNGLTPATATFAQCVNTGVTAAQYGNGSTTNTIPQCVSNQCATELGGNPALKPEKAKTFSIGFTLTPTFIDGLTASVDYFKIDLNGVIAQGAIPIAIALNGCLTTGNPLFCTNVVRGQLGNLNGSTVAGGGFLKATFQNAASVNTSGVDLQTDYQTDLSDWGLGANGGLDFRLVGTATLRAKTITFPGQPAYDCNGLFGTKCGSPGSAWRHQFRVTWETPWDFAFSTQWRYFSGVGLDTNTLQAGLTNGKIDLLNARIPAVSYFDVTGTWQATDFLELRAGITNLFDKDPPIISNTIVGSGTPNVYNTYDLFGRNVFVAATAKF